MIVDRVGDKLVAGAAVRLREFECRREHGAAGDSRMELKRRGNRSVHADGVALGCATDNPGDQGGWSEFDVRR